MVLEWNFEAIWDLVETRGFFFWLGVKKFLWIWIHISLQTKSWKLAAWNIRKRTREFAHGGCN